MTDLNSLVEFETNQRVSREVIEKELNEGWRAQGDDFRTFLGEFVARLPQIEFPVGLSP